jgi:hypothetical protein
MRDFTFQSFCINFDAGLKTPVGSPDCGPTAFVAGSRINKKIGLISENHNAGDAKKVTDSAGPSASGTGVGPIWSPY